MLHKISGAAAISTILIIGIIVSEIALASLVTSYFSSQGGLGTRVVYNASFAAQSGINDALLKIARDKDFAPSPYSYYALEVGSAAARIDICIDKITTDGSNPPTCNDSDVPEGTREVTSLGTALNKEVRIRAILYVDPSTGLITIQSLKEIST
jgi:hypothetical protein